MVREKHDPEHGYEEFAPPQEYGDEKRRQSSAVLGDRKASVSEATMLRNPLAGMSKEELYADVSAFAAEKGLEDAEENIKKGALIAQNPKGFEHLSELSEEEKEILRREQTSRWKQPFMMYFMTILCAGSAIVQGMDQSAVNGAQIFYFYEFNIPASEPWRRGLLNGAPYVCSALIGCWTTKPLNFYFGRRGTIFISCFVSVVTGIWMAVADSWYNLLIARFALGLAVGAKSSTTPVYAAECAPTVIRGALTMMWQMWTAFGIMLGFVVSVAFYYVGPQIDPSLPRDQNPDRLINWRLMLGMTSVPPFLVMIQVYLVPESPRWYMTKNKYRKAYNALCRFRNDKIQAARDVYYIHKSLQIEEKQKEGKNLWKEFFGVGRNRRAAQSSFFVMFMQQFCGVNVIAYYSTQIFIDAGFTQPNALAVSLGTGIVNWLFAIPAVYTIDTFGRRNLLLTTFPLMGIFLLFTGMSFFIGSEGTGITPANAMEYPSEGRLIAVAIGIYLFMVVYSPGEGPVPFTYSAEAFPLYIREYGMAFATATTWGFNFILSLTWPALVNAFTSQGAFAYYACWNFFGWGFAYFFLPETKELSLEELDMVFSIPSTFHGKYYWKSLPYYGKKYILRKDVETRPPLYEVYDQGYSA